MKYSEVRREFRATIRAAAFASAVVIPSIAVCGDEQDKNDGGVSIRLILAPSHPDLPPAEVEQAVERVALGVSKADTGGEKSPPLPEVDPGDTQPLAPSHAASQPALSPEPLALESSQPRPATTAETDRPAAAGRDSSNFRLGPTAPAYRMPATSVNRYQSPQRLDRARNVTAEPAPPPPASSIRASGQPNTPDQAEKPLERVNAAKPDATSDLDHLRELVSNSAPAGPIRIDHPQSGTGVSTPDLGSKDSVGGECPGSPDGEVHEQTSQPGDIPLIQSEHPYDAPSASQAKSASETPTYPSTQTRISDPGFSSREMKLQQGIHACLNYFITHPENVVRRGPWALMHATLPLGTEAEVIAGNRRVSAIGWMCFNGVCAKQRMFQPTRTGFRTNNGPGVQGHEGQFLAILAQSQVSPEYPLKIGNKTYQVQDLVRYEMSTCREKSELTFKLIGLSHYLPGDARWRDNRGRTWNLEKMVAEELAQPVIGAACGGTHRLMGLTYALQKRAQAGLPTTGNWARADQYLNDYVDFAMSLQNRDGSFSTEWFEGRGMDQDVERKVQTTGHILEWLIFSLPDDQLRSPRIQQSVEFLVDSVGSNPSYDWPIGPRGHALRALTLYNQRVFGAEVGKLKEHIAQQQSTSVRR